MSDWEDINSSEWEDVPSDAGFVDYLKGAGKSALSGLIRAGSGAEQMISDAFSGIENYTGIPLPNELIGSNATESRSYAAQLDQDINKSLPDGIAKRATQVIGGSLPAMATLLSGNPILTATTIGLSSAADKYSQLRDKNAEEPLTAGANALGTGAVNALTSAIPLKFIGTSQGPLLRRWLLESAKVGAGNAAISPLQVGGNALVDTATLDKAPSVEDVGGQTRQAVEDALITAPLWGLMGAVGGNRSGDKNPKAPGPTADDMLSRINQEVQVASSTEASQPKGSLVLDSDLPIIDQRAPQVDPLIQIEDAYRTRDLGARQKELDDMFFPEDSELSGLRQSPPSNPSEVIDIQRTQPVREPAIQLADGTSDLTALERQAANEVRSVSKSEIQKAQIAENEAVLREILAKRDENRNLPRSSELKSEKDLVIRVDDGNQTLPAPIIKDAAAVEGAPSQVVLPPGTELDSSSLPLSLAPDRLKPEAPPFPEIQQVEGYKPRAAPEVLQYDPLMEQVSQLTKGSANSLSDGEIPIVGQEPQRLNPQDIISPDEASINPSNIYVDPQSDVGRQRAAAQRLVNSQRQEVPNIIPGEVYKARQAQEQNARGRRIASKKGAAVSKQEVFGPSFNSEGGFGADWLIKLFMRDPNVALPDYKEVSETNKRYARVWPSMVEWMDTTRKKAPQSAGFIDSYWKIPQDLNSIVYDAKLTLDPYLGLTQQERKPVDNYLAAARIMGSRNPNYKITAQTAAQIGLSPKQAEAAIAVNKWSGEMLNLLEDHAVQVAEHNAGKKGTTLSPTQRQEITDRFNELRNSNYVPFNRYGEHYVNVFDKDGNLAYRFQFEKKTDPDLAKTVNHFKQLISQPGTDVSGGKVQYGKSDPAQLNERDGVPSDVLEILNDDGAHGEVRGFYKHLKPAALVKGFNPDMLKSISEYTAGAAKLVSLQRAKMGGERELLAMSPGGLRGADNVNLVKKLTAWADGFNQKTSPAFQALNNAFNVAYIGGNLRTPTADMLGRIQLQYPLMSKYLKGIQPESAFARGIGKELKWWFSTDTSFAKSEPALAGGIKEAQRRGVIPTNLYKTFLRNARGEYSGTPAFKNKVHDLYFGLKEISERSTDLGGFILGWEMYPQYMAGKGKGRDTRTRQQFAEDFVRESRAVPSQGELPAVFKSNSARLVTKYRLYQAKILKSLSQAGLGQWARYLMATGFTTGVAGLPFVRDAFNAARFGGVEPEDKLREAGAGPATMYGPMSDMAGIDFSGSAGFGEVFPGSGGNVASKFLLGMAGAPFEAMTRSYNYFQRGQHNKGVGALPFMPNTVSNFLTQKDWGERGVVTLGGKAVIPRDEVQIVDRIKKLLGYQPLRVKEAMVLENRKKQATSEGRDDSFMNQRIGEALGINNMEEAQVLAQDATKKGIRLNPNSIKEYAVKIQGREGKIPKKARGEVRRIEDLYGNAIRD